MTSTPTSFNEVGITTLILQIKKSNTREVKKLAQGHIARSDLSQSVFSSKSFNFHIRLPPKIKVIGVMETKVQ